MSLEVDVRRVGADRPIEARFRLAPGIRVLFGPSGAGKSTCLAMLAGLVPAHRGRIELGGALLFDDARAIDVPPHARDVALVFQQLALFPHLSVLDNVAYGAKQRDRAARRREAERWIEAMRIAPLARRMPLTLSGGEAQRVALARAFASAPRLLLLDEPFSALHASLREELRDETSRQVEALGIPALLVTHDPGEAASFGPRPLSIEGGRVLEEA